MSLYDNYMKSYKRDLGKSFLCSLATMAYITLVAFVLSNGEKWFGRVGGFLAPTAMLTLFVFSALVTSSFVLGGPIWMYFEGEKKRALRFFVFNAGWILLVLVGIFSGLVFVK